MTVVLYFPLMLIIALCDKKIFPISKKVKFRFIYVVLFLIMGLRVGFGRDYEMYVDIYNIPYGFFDYRYFEPVWGILYEGLKYIGFKSRMFIFITSGFIIWGVYKANRLYGVDLFVATLVFILSGIYFETSNTIRQCVAQVLVFLSLPYFQKGKIIEGSIYAISSFVFHNSAVFAILLLIISKFKYNRLLMMSVVIICCFYGQMMIDIVLQRVVPALAEYGKYQYDVSDFSDGVSSGLLKFVYLSLSLLFIMYQGKMEKISPLYGRYAVNLFVFSICTYCMFYSFQPVRRLFAYGFMFIMIAFPLFLKTQSSITAKIVGWVYAIIFLLFQTKLSFGTEYDFDIDFI